MNAQREKAYERTNMWKGLKILLKNRNLILTFLTQDQEMCHQFCLLDCKTPPDF